MPAITAALGISPTASGANENAVPAAQAAGNLADEAINLIIPQAPRPSGIMILSVLGIIFSILGLLAGILVTSFEAAALYGFSKSRPYGSVLVLAGWLIFCVFMLGFLHISIGLLRRQKTARRAFIVLTVLIFLFALMPFFLSLGTNGDYTGYKLDFIKGVSLLYLLISLVYLQLKRVKTWFY